MGAVVVTVDSAGYSPIDCNSGYQVRGSLHLSSSYASGGDTITPAQFGLGTLLDIDLDPIGGNTYTWDSANGKILGYTTTGTQVSGDQSAVNIRFMAWGY